MLERLRVEGVPQGAWLIEVEQARNEIQHVDTLLRRLAAAIIAGMGGPDLGG